MAGRRIPQKAIAMMQGFMEYHLQGLGIHEIAKIFHVSDATVYNHLDEIAKANGVQREDLLKKIQPPRNIEVKNKYVHAEFCEVQDLISELEIQASKIIEKIEVKTA